MARKTQWASQKTLPELYKEREKNRWYWRCLGLLSASMILLGFLVFPGSFQTDAQVSVNQGTLSIVAVILLALGYSLSVALWFLCQSWLFQLDVLFMPCLSSCFLGLLNIGISLGVHPTTKSQWTISSISAVTLATVSTIIYVTLSLLTYRKIAGVRAGDGFQRHNRNDSESHPLTEDDAQRQLFARLLSQQEDKPNKGLFPAASQQTFHIDIPENSKVSKYSPHVTTYLTAPSHTHSASPQRRSFSSTPLEDQFSLIPGHVQENKDPKLLKLERAREKSAQTRGREVSQGPPVIGPPVIVNTRSVDMQYFNHVPNEELHPLEREEHIRGVTVPKDSPYLDRDRPAVYRPEDEDYLPYEVELEDSSQQRGRRVIGRGELEAEVIPRIVRVQTDGWPGNVL